MKTKIIIPIIVLTLVLVTKSVFAEDAAITSTPKTIRNQIKQEIQELRQGAKPTIAQIREEKKAALSELKQKKIQGIYDNVKNGLEKRYAALLKIKAKLDARILKNPMNKDTTKAKEELVKFEAAENLYKTDLAKLETIFLELKSSDKPSENLKVLKDATKIVQDDLSAIKKVLTSAVTTLAKAPKLEVSKTE